MNKKCTFCDGNGILHVPIYEENYGWIDVGLPENLEYCDQCQTEKKENENEEDH